MEEIAKLDERKLKSDAITYLIEGQEIQAASILFASQMETLITYDDIGNELLEITLKGNRATYDSMQEENSPVRESILRSLEAVAGPDYCVIVRSQVQYSDLGIDWEAKLLEAIQERKSPNQCQPIEDAPTYEWNNLYFRSPVEIQIAKELDKRDVLFLPNCMARLGKPFDRVRKEADFIVCYKGKWGIIEVDGETYHTSAAKDHNRDRLFKQHRIRVYERYEAKKCLQNPGAVVTEFLDLLEQNG